MGNFKPLNNNELSVFFDQMSMLINVGISPIDGITTMIDDAANPEAKKILSKIEETYLTGTTFYEALCSAEVFPKYALNLIKIGEESGKIEEVLAALSYHYEHTEQISENIKSAITYPFIIIGMMSVVILVLIIKVLPIFEDVFLELGAELTGMSKSLLNMGNAISNYSIVFIIILCLAIAAYFFFAKTHIGKKAFAKFSGVFFLTKNLSEMIATSSFASGLALSLSAGLDFTAGVEMAAPLSSNTKVSKKIYECLLLLEKNESLSDSLTKSNIFNGMYSNMLIIGNKTGSMDQVLKKISKSLDRECEIHISNLVSVIEPTLVIILSIIICLILMSVMLPLMGILSGML